VKDENKYLWMTALRLCCFDGGAELLQYSDGGGNGGELGWGKGGKVTNSEGMNVTRWWIYVIVESGSQRGV